EHHPPPRANPPPPPFSVGRHGPPPHLPERSMLPGSLLSAACRRQGSRLRMLRPRPFGGLSRELVSTSVILRFVVGLALRFHDPQAIVVRGVDQAVRVVHQERR